MISTTKAQFIVTYMATWLATRSATGQDDPRRTGTVAGIGVAPSFRPPVRVSEALQQAEAAWLAVQVEAERVGMMEVVEAMR